MKLRRLFEHAATVVTFLSFALLSAAYQHSAAAATSATQTIVHSFTGSDGAHPNAGVFQGSDGNFYGTTNDAGTGGSYGHIYKMTPNGGVSVLHTFDTTAGTAPRTELVQASDGNFYGTTSTAIGGDGTLFKVDTSGNFTPLYTFASGGAMGSMPLSALVEAADGNFYGTTYGGGATTDYGTIFKMTPQGTVTTVYTFDGVSASKPSGSLAMASDGTLYGTTEEGGTAGYGTVYKLSSGANTITVLHNFNYTDGSQPKGVTLGSDGNLYGMTALGGGTFGTIFKVTTSGTFTLLHSLAGLDGSAPNGALVEGNDGNFYGMTSQTVFQITPSGTFTKLLQLSTPTTTGATPFGNLIQASDGAFYGTTADGDGVVFKMTLSGTSSGYNLAATAGDGQVTLTWSAVTGASSYNVYQGTTSGGEL